MTSVRRIPSIEQLRQRDAVRALEARYGRQAVVTALREEAEVLRQRLTDAPDTLRETDGVSRELEMHASARLERTLAPSLRIVINATGVIVHTNLGRAPLARAAIDRISTVAAGYANLEYDLIHGVRGARAEHAAALLTRLTGAEAAAVVNNNAAAVLLVLAALAAGREVIISRGELVEIGGGFRIPEVLQQSGARLREVGTTNRTRPADYAAAITDRTALILRVHPSNFRIEGFAERPTLEQVAEIGRRFDIPVVEDLGSGNVFEAARPAGFCPLDEPTVRASVDAGITACCFSGDKLFGGPQAGIIVGRETALSRIRTHPLLRALRVDKLTYAALEATLLEHLAGRATDTVPVSRMIAATTEALMARAQKIVEALAGVAGLTVTLQPSESVIGGGTTPGTTIPTWVLNVRVSHRSTEETEAALRGSTPPVVGRVERGQLLLDLRTVQPEEDEVLIAALRGLTPMREPPTKGKGSS